MTTVSLEFRLCHLSIWCSSYSSMPCWPFCFLSLLFPFFWFLFLPMFSSEALAFPKHEQIYQILTLSTPHLQSSAHLFSVLQTVWEVWGRKADAAVNWNSEKGTVAIILHLQLRTCGSGGWTFKLWTMYFKRRQEEAKENVAEEGENVQRSCEAKEGKEGGDGCLMAPGIRALSRFPVSEPLSA